MNEPPVLILDELLNVLATRPPRVLWQQPRIMHPIHVECAEALRDAGYSVVTCVIRDVAYLVARYRIHEVEETT